MSAKTTTTDLLLMLFPSIIGRLNQLLIKFSSDFEQASEKKKDKLPNYSTPANAALLSNFPHSYEHYAKCVNSFVDIGKNSPDSAISVLLTILPNRPKSSVNSTQDNYLYQKIRNEVSGYGIRSNIYDLVLILFFADCTAQILTVEPNTKYASDLFELSYKMIEPFSESYELPLRITIAKQFSVIFGLLSIDNLASVLHNFTQVAAKSDPSLFFILHRFLRLSISGSLPHDEIKNFLHTFNLMNPNSNKEFSKYFPLFKTNKKPKEVKDNKDAIRIAANMWALSLYSLSSQLNVSGAPFFADVLKEIYSSALPKASGKTPHLYHVMLCSNIIMRIQDDEKKNFSVFLNDVIFKKVKDKEGAKYLQQSLQGFLIIIRGNYCSRTTFFWEWGAYNAMWKPGVEASHLFQPEQKQNSEDSFTNLFFQYFDNLPIEQYPQIVSDILFNFAARDFPFFIQSTIPKLIETVGPEHAISCLQGCIQKIIDPQRHFSEWAQENPLNNNVRIDMAIPLLFNPLKVNIFSLISSMLPQKLMEEAYCFRLTDSTDFPHFSLPSQLERIPRSVKKAIGYATVTVRKALNDWQVNYEQSNFFLKVVLTAERSISEDEVKLIRLLEFVPRIINASDLTNNFGNDLITSFLSHSSSVSFFSIRIINQIFAAIDKSRIIIYNLLINSIIKTTNPVHVFMLFQLLNKLFDLSLDPACTESQIKKLVHDLQPTILYLLTFPYPEIRDIVLIFINTLTKFCSVYKIEIPFSEILNKFDPTISAVARYNIIKNNSFYTDNSVFVSIPKSFITTREAALSQYEEIYRFFLIEISNTYSHIISTKLLIKSIKIFLNILPPHPDNYSSPEYYHYANIIDVIMHIFPTIPNESPSQTMQKYLESRLTPFYDFPSLSKKVTGQDKEELNKSLEKLNELIQSIISRLSISSDVALRNQTDAIIKALHFISAPIIEIIMDPFLKWLNESIKNAETTERDLKIRDKDKDADKNKSKDADSSKNSVAAYMQLATDIIVKVSQSPDLNFAFMACNKSKEGFLSFIQRIESYLEERKLIFQEDSDVSHFQPNANQEIGSGSDDQTLNANTNINNNAIGNTNFISKFVPNKLPIHQRHRSVTQNDSFPQTPADLFLRFDIQKGDMRIALNYAEIVKNFADGLRIQVSPINEGPIRSIDEDPWIKEKYSLQARRKTLGILSTWTQFSDPSKSLLPYSIQNTENPFIVLGKKSLQAIGSLVRFNTIFDSEYPIPPQLENQLISIESKYERYLPGLLAFHRGNLLNIFAFKMLTESCFVSPHYFEAVSRLYFNQIDDSYSRKLGFNMSSNVALIVSQVRKVKMNRTVSRAFSGESINELESEQKLTHTELSLNKELLKYAPRIIVSCFLYLLHKEFQIRVTAFKLLYRILPILKTVIYPSHPNLVAKMMKKVQELSPIFNSQLSIITPEVVIKLSKIFAKEFPFLSDIIIKEIFKIVSKASDNSYISLSNAGVLIRVFTPMFKLQVPCFSDLNDKDKWPHKKHLIVFTPYTLMTGLLQIASKIDQSNLGYYLTIWKDLASSAKDSLENIVQYLLNLTIEENKNCLSSIKMVLLELAKVERGIVINALVSRLTYAYWFHTTLEGKLATDKDNQKLPTPFDISLFDRIILTLTEIAQIYFESVIPFISIIFNFALLYYDQSNNYLTDLLLIIVSNLSNCPDKFTNALIPPSSLIWPEDMDPLPTEFSIKRFTASEISLRSFSKKPVSIMSFVRAFKNYLMKYSKETVTNWAKEAARWASGCGDLLIAGRACFILAELMEPVRAKTLIPIIKSLSIITQAKQNNLTHFYIVSVFHLFSAFFDKYKERSKPQKKPPKLPLGNHVKGKFKLRLKLKNSDDSDESDSKEKPESPPQSESEHENEDENDGNSSDSDEEKSKKEKKNKKSKHSKESDENDSDDDDSEDEDKKSKKKKSKKSKHHEDKKESNEEKSKNDDENSKSNIIIIKNDDGKEDGKDDEKDISDLFMLLFQIAAAFLSLSEEDNNDFIFGTLCQDAMSIITSFTIQSKCENCDIKKLLMRLSSLTSYIRQKENLYAAILAIFYRERKEPKSMISMITFCCFLPTVYIAIAAYNNIHPFSAEMDDEQIAEVIGCLSLIVQTASCPMSLKMLITQLVSDPSSISPDDFILQACSALSNPSSACGPSSTMYSSIQSSVLLGANSNSFSSNSSFESKKKAKRPSSSLENTESADDISADTSKNKDDKKKDNFNSDSESDLSTENDYNSISVSEINDKVRKISNEGKDDDDDDDHNEEEEFDYSQLLYTTGGTACFPFDKIVEKTAPYLCKATKNANTEGYRSAVFAVVGAFLQSSSIDSKIASYYEPIVRIAASRHSSTQASDMLQTFMQKMPVCYEVSKNIPTADASPILNNVTAISGLSVTQAALFTMTTQDDVISQSSNVSPYQSAVITDNSNTNNAEDTNTNGTANSGTTTTFVEETNDLNGNNNNANPPPLRNANSCNLNINHRRQISYPNDALVYESLENSSTVRKLVDLTSDLKVDLPNGESSLESCLIIVPIDCIDNWNADFVKEIRNKLATVKVINYPFVWNSKFAETVDSLEVGDGKLNELGLPEEYHIYYSYLPLLKK